MCILEPAPTDHIAKSGEGGGIVDNVYRLKYLQRISWGERLFDLFVTILAILDICSNESRGV